jgi:murein DD-endopeptidase MepM/ murein hydrolase activator NlpD
VWPARGAITSVFGNDNGRRHPGIDIGLLQSLAVRAAVPGRVILVGRPRGYEGYGNVIVVRTTRRQTEIYAHLAAYRVKRGQRVGPGQRLGTAGCTGWCTGTHLHFEVRRDGRPVNPVRTVLRQARMPATWGG